MPAASSQHYDSRSARPDGPTGASTVRWRREVPESIRSLGALADSDYADIVTATVDQTPTDPEQVVHTTVNGLPRWLPLLIAFVQRVFLGLRLKLRPSPDRILGWQIADREENWIRIEAASWFLTGHVVMHVDEGQVSLASFIRYDRRLAAFVWPPVSLIHRQVALALIRRGIRGL